VDRALREQVTERELGFKRCIERVISLGRGSRLSVLTAPRTRYDRPVDRRTARSAARADLLIRALEGGQTRTAAAAMAGIARSTLGEWMSDPAFSDMVERAEGVAEARMAGTVLTAAFQGNVAAAQWLLERRRPEDYGRKERLDQRLQDETNRATVEIVARRYGLDPDDVLREAEAIMREVAGGRHKP
jgi:hypothetical protein